MKVPKCLICKSKCNKSKFESYPRWIKRKYCSNKCRAKSKENKIKYKCDYCRKTYLGNLSKHGNSKRHYCNRTCYSKYVEEKLPFTEQPAYQGIRKKGETIYIYHRRYVLNNKTRIAHLKARRYAREKGAIGSHTLQEWIKLKKSHNYRCAKCQKKRKLTKDHIIPLSKKGTDYIENIQPLCRNCNSKKGKNKN